MPRLTFISSSPSSSTASLVPSQFFSTCWCMIMAVKRRPSLQSNASILLACLAATDALPGLTTQPSFIAWKTSQLVGFKIRSGLFRYFGHNLFIRLWSVCSCLHLVLVTCERLIAIKFTMHYYDIATEKLR